MIQNKVEEHFNYANEKAGELALKAKEISKKNVLIAGSLPGQNDTYVLDQRDKKIIEKGQKTPKNCVLGTFFLSNWIQNRVGWLPRLSSITGLPPNGKLYQKTPPLYNP